MRYALLVVAIFLFLTMEWPILDALRLGSYNIDLPLIASVYLAGSAPTTAGFVLSVLLGLMVDALTPGAILGLHMEVMGLIFLIARGLSSRLEVMRPGPMMIAVFLCEVAKTLLIFLFSVIFDREGLQPATFFSRLLPSVLVTTLVVPIFLPPIRWVLGSGRSSMPRDRLLL